MEPRIKGARKPRGKLSAIKGAVDLKTFRSVEEKLGEKVKRRHGDRNNQRKKER